MRGIRKEKEVIAQAIWADESLRNGDFYELAIEFKNDWYEEMEVVELFNSIFVLDWINGPFDNEFNAIQPEYDASSGYNELIGYIVIGDMVIPFKTIFTTGEEGTPNWLDICFHTAMYQKVLGSRYEPWLSDDSSHEVLDKLLIKILKKINTKFEISLGLIGWEVSRMYSAESLELRALSQESIAAAQYFVNENQKVHKNNDSIVIRL